MGRQRRTPRGCVDRNYGSKIGWQTLSRRTPRGCVDRNHTHCGVEGQVVGSHPTRVRGSKQLSQRNAQGVLLSHPTRVRGSKHVVTSDKGKPFGRTPRGCVDRNRIIEINKGTLERSHPTRVRGSKLHPYALRLCSRLSHPTRVRGSKPRYHAHIVSTDMSHPTRVRGSKHEQKGKANKLY